ncbi:hypothetical protein DTB58_39055 [Streptomyces griseus]|nr:hypothetical protein [Streptomyces griseus]
MIDGDNANFTDTQRRESVACISSSSRTTRSRRASHTGPCRPPSISLPPSPPSSSPRPPSPPSPLQDRAAHGQLAAARRPCLN